MCDASVITPQQLSSLLSQIPAQTALHAPLSVGAVPGAVPINDAAPTAPMANLNIHRDDEKKQPNNFYQPSPAATPAPPPAYAAPPPSMPPLAQATALYAYNGTDPGDLELQPNDHINVMEYMNAEWWKGRSSRTGQEGIFPRSYVRVIENALPQSAPTSYGNMPLEVSGQGDGSGKVPTKMQEGGKKIGKKVNYQSDQLFTSATDIFLARKCCHFRCWSHHWWQHCQLHLLVLLLLLPDSEEPIFLMFGVGGFGSFDSAIYRTLCWRNPRDTDTSLPKVLPCDDLNFIVISKTECVFERFCSIELRGITV